MDGSYCNTPSSTLLIHLAQQRSYPIHHTTHKSPQSHRCGIRSVAL